MVWFLIILFESVYPFTLQQHTETYNNTILFVIAIVSGEFTMMILRKYVFQVCVISFDFYLSHYKVYIHLP